MGGAFSGLAMGNETGGGRVSVCVLIVMHGRCLNTIDSVIVRTRPARCNHGLDFREASLRENDVIISKWWRRLFGSASFSFFSWFCFFVLFCFVLFYFVLFCFVLFCFVLFCFVLFCFFLFCFVSFLFVLFCFVLFCFVLSSCYDIIAFFCFVLFCSVLYASSKGGKGGGGG